MRFSTVSASSHPKMAGAGTGTESTGQDSNYQDRSSATKKLHDRQRRGLPRSLRTGLRDLYVVANILIH